MVSFPAPLLALHVFSVCVCALVIVRNHRDLGGSQGWGDSCRTGREGEGVFPLPLGFIQAPPSVDPPPGAGLWLHLPSPPQLPRGIGICTAVLQICPEEEFRDYVPAGLLPGSNPIDKLGLVRPYLCTRLLFATLFVRAKTTSTPIGRALVK